MSDMETLTRQNTTYIYGVEVFYKQDNVESTTSNMAVNIPLVEKQLLLIHTYGWTKSYRFSLLLLSCMYGSIINCFFIVVLNIDAVLKRLGNVYLMAMAGADLGVTTIVMPIMIIVLLNDTGTTVKVCNLLQLCTEISTYSYALLSMLVTLKRLVKLHPLSRMHDIFVSMPIEIVIPSIVLISTIVGIVGIYAELDYDFCEREHHGNLLFRAITNLFVLGLPSVFSLIGTIYVKVKLRGQNSPRNIISCSIADLDIISFAVFIVSWTPYLMTIYLNPTVNDAVYYHLLWFALARSVISTSFYFTLNKYFRSAFISIINKIFCCICCFGANSQDDSATDSHSELEQIFLRMMRERDRVEQPNNNDEYANEIHLLRETTV